MVLFSISLATAPEAENIAMNKLVKNSVDNPISRKNLLSSLIVYIVRDGLIKNKNRAAIIIMA
jgi:NAD+--asparagine ADP-ribosyltransferase